MGLIARVLHAAQAWGAGAYPLNTKARGVEAKWPLTAARGPGGEDPGRYSFPI